MRSYRFFHLEPPSRVGRATVCLCANALTMEAIMLSAGALQPSPLLGPGGGSPWAQEGRTAAL
eukprot:7311158-Alexandrium_andersonii.AAC.1